MRIEIEMPKEFEEHFKQDKFKDSLERIMADIEHSLNNGDCLCAGRYEYETIEMLQKAFENSKQAYSVDKNIEKLEKAKTILERDLNCLKQNKALPDSIESMEMAINALENQTCEGYEHGRILTNAEADKWNEYKQLEEQGLLLRLPVKAGDTVYAIGFNNNKPIIYESAILSILITEKEIVFNVKVDEFGINSQLKQSMFGKTVFLTQAEAEQKLKESKS